ncbi:hypothetical protein V5799_025293 [Amblyomma americanum]|uniref:Uncharacterized protein n=1 Tax=Amblyomma americanum TaxID=6943 RepID=A0AAQ4EA41_AMBAM
MNRLTSHSICEAKRPWILLAMYTEKRRVTKHRQAGLRLLTSGHLQTLEFSKNESAYESWCKSACLHDLKNSVQCDCKAVKM